MKTIILWQRKGCRSINSWKQVGLATADGSAATIRSLYLMAQNKEGKLAIVDAPSADHARRMIADHLAGRRPDIGAPPIKSHLGDRVFTLGANAVLAIGGASEAIAHWDARLERDGKVKTRDTSALGVRSDGVIPRIDDYFGARLK